MLLFFVCGCCFVGTSSFFFFFELLLLFFVLCCYSRVIYCNSAAICCAQCAKICYKCFGQMCTFCVGLEGVCQFCGLSCHMDCGNLHMCGAGTTCDVCLKKRKLMRYMAVCLDCRAPVGEESR